MLTYDEEQKLRFKLKQLEGSLRWYKERLERANKIMSDNHVGPYKYTETPEQRFKRLTDNACERIRIRGEIAAERIRITFSEHEVIDYCDMKLTCGTLFEQLKKNGS